MPHRDSEIPVIPPPPFGPSFSQNVNSKDATRDPESEKKCNLHSHQSSANAYPFAAPTHLAVIKPMTRSDILALIFVFLMLPQGVSMILLLAYILSGSFKSIASRVIARYLTQWDRITSKDCHESPYFKVRYARSAMVSQFFQLFSINSAILLACYYILPQTWFYYFAVLAKSIIASKVVGSYISGSTTYVSVVGSSNQSSSQSPSLHHNQGAPINGWNPTSSFSTTKNDPRNSLTSVINSIAGCLLVITTNNMINNFVLNLNVPHLVADVVKFYRGLWHINKKSALNDGLSGFQYESFVRAFFTKSPFQLSLNYLNPRKLLHYTAHKRLLENYSVFTKLFTFCFVKFFKLNDNTIQLVDVVMKEVSTVMNYAYLVLCIHVISLTISPFLHRCFILKDYSKTLDNLSSFTPELSFPNYKPVNSVMPTSLKESTSESFVVVNVDQPGASSSSREPLEVNVKQAVSVNSKNASAPQRPLATPASNFEVFCLSSPFNKAASLGNKVNFSSTQGSGGNTSGVSNLKNTLDRRNRSSSGALHPPSTTIIDKQYVKLVQPLWSWLAAIKILALKPLYFSGKETTKKDNGMPFYHTTPPTESPVAIYGVEDNRVLLAVLNSEVLLLKSKKFSIYMNGVYWKAAFWYTINTGDKPLDIISIEGLMPLYLYEISITSEEELISHSVVTTTDHNKSPSYSSYSVDSGKEAMILRGKEHLQVEVDEVKAHFRKLKRDENKKLGDLKKQIDSIKAKIDRYWVKLDDGKSTGKFKGLQNSVVQLEQEIKALKAQMDEFNANTEKSEASYKAEEDALHKQIAELEQFILEHEQNTHLLKGDVRAVEVDKNNYAVKKQKLVAKIESRKEEISKMNGEMKQLRKVMLLRIQRRQKKIQERMDTILPKVNTAIEEMEGEYAL